MIFLLSKMLKIIISYFWTAHVHRYQRFIRMNTPPMATAFHVGLFLIFASLNHKSFVCNSDYCRSRKLPCSCDSYFFSYLFVSCAFMLWSLKFYLQKENWRPWIQLAFTPLLRHRKHTSTNCVVDKKPTCFFLFAAWVFHTNSSHKSPKMLRFQS